MSANNDYEHDVSYFPEPVIAPVANGQYIGTQTGSTDPLDPMNAAAYALNTPEIEYKYNEDLSFAELQEYIDSTYDAHYALKNDLQVFDIWESTDSLETTARDTAIKYLMRYGKKNGRNRKDLLKAVHYILLMMYVGDQLDETPAVDDDR